jgi:hypothetical protein
LRGSEKESTCVSTIEGQVPIKIRGIPIKVRGKFAVNTACMSVYMRLFAGFEVLVA